MASSFFHLILDTLPPGGLGLAINGDAKYTTSAGVTLQITVADTDTTGYRMKIWGVLGAETQEQAVWQTFTETKAVSLLAGDGKKTVYLKLQDDVGNETEVVSDEIILDMKVPVVSVDGPDRANISKIPTFDKAIFSFRCDVEFEEYKVCIVPKTSAIQDGGIDIPTNAGSTNVSGKGVFPADTPISVTLCGGDLESAVSGDGVKIIKVFVKNEAGTWSVA